MWRFSATLSFSSRLLSSSFSTNPNYFHHGFAFSVFALNGVVEPPLSPSYQRFCFSSSAPSPSPSSGSVIKLWFLADKSEAFRPLSSKARDAIQLARHYGRCYWELSKARLSLLVVATSGTGYVLGSGNAVDLAGLCCTCAGTMMVAASANSLNQVFEINNDAKMKRTRQRPLPSGRITVPHAVTWASSVGFSGTALLAFKANMLAAGLAASNLVLYAFVYTPLKQIHPVNTWVGAVVGAIPPLLGYRMFSLADPSGQRTAAVAFRNCLYLIPLGFIAYDWGVATGWFCVESTLITLAISAAALSFYRDRTTQKARRMFYASLLYLPVFMSGLLFHRLSDNQRCLADNPDRIVELSSTSQDLTESGEDYQKKKVRHLTAGPQARSPVAYASIAPFPFLPVPSYVDP
ncbi:protoheme IX farnesyltransferase, mitochondrial-like isoform X2 [Durio zibethinus]|uniref:Heme O synthase n=1 Tax=Durio zibethinus TaxID=66656 RepID=A0A6P5X376_DURZI|nr:protoheme IX farnesyltransferase, mitochondrial-like isoform X2 [Durio zibethinus]